MRVVVTGATGNVGTSLVERLETEDGVSSVVGIARRRPEPNPSLSKVEWVAADVATDDLGPVVDGAQVLVHLAWLFQPTHRPTVTWRANAIGSARVFEAAADAGVGALVCASSVAAYSPAPGQSVTESWPTHSLPTAAYGREKAYVERVLDAFEARHSLVRVVRIRPSFVFQRRSATEQRRIFAGPLVPKALVAPGRLPLLPVPPGLRFQAVHADDLAEAYRLAIVGEVDGAFNIAAEPPIDARVLAEALGTRAVEVPRLVVRAALALAWRAHVVPIEPALLDLVLELPLLDTGRARDVLGWAPGRSATDALGEVIEGMAGGAGGETAPLGPDTLGRRLGEIASGVGERP
jgi:UDP-glucose 4-epimerase